MMQTHTTPTAKTQTPRSETCTRVVIDRAGNYDRLVLREQPAPEPGPNEVLVDVRAIGVNYADCMVRMGLYQSAKEFVGWPITPGFEVSGVVTAVGDEVIDVDVGDAVLVVTLFNGYSTQVCVDAKYVFPIPKGLSFEEAAGLPAVYMTAYYALFELAHPRPGSKMLIHSAAGGVGGCLVQLAKVAGCEVTGVVGGTHKIETARAHGCDHVIDKSEQDLWAEAEKLAPEGYDVICDANGVATLKQSYEHLRKAGKLVVYGFHTMMPKKGGKPNWLKLAVGYVRTPRFNPLQMTMDSKSVLSFNLSYLFDRVDLLEEGIGRVVELLGEGAITAPPVTTYAFEDVAQAHRDIESGNTVGKLVLVP